MGKNNAIIDTLQQTVNQLNQLMPCIKELKSEFDYGMVDKSNMLDDDMTTRRAKIKKSHGYVIMPPNSTRKYWCTHYKRDDKTRILVRTHSEEELLDKLIELYETDTNLEKFTFHLLFLEWLEYKTPLTNSYNTIKRHRQHYTKYFEPSKLYDMKLCAIDTLILETECNRIVKEFNLSRQNWVNTKTILKGMFEYARRKKYITENPLEDVRISVRFRQVVKKTGKSQTFNTDELKALNDYLDNMYEQTKDSAYIAVRANLMLGLRVGELVALKPEDILETQIHVVREEIRDQETNQCYVVEHTKTNDDRFVVLVPKAKALLDKLDMNGTYLFERNGERLRARQIAYVLEKYAERQGVPTKSTHKMRKTYASLLNSNGVPLDAIREQLGHTNLTTTLSYIYNPLTEQETFSLISGAL